MSKRLPVKTLDAYLRGRHMNLSAVFLLIDVDQKYLAVETVSTKIVGRIARLYNMTPEELVDVVERFERDTLGK